MVSLGACPAGQLGELPALGLNDAVADEALLHAVELLCAVRMPQVYSSKNSPVLAPEQRCHAQHPPPQLALGNAHLQGDNVEVSMIRRVLDR